MSATTKGLAGPVPPLALPEHFSEVRSFQAHQARSSRLGMMAACLAAAVCGAGMLAEGVAIARMVPLQRIEPVYVVIRPDGTHDLARSLSELPASLNEAVLRSTMWTYVREREGYSYWSAKEQWDTVNAMSTPEVWEPFFVSFRYDNPRSVQRLIGLKGHIKVDPISVAEIAGSGGRTKDGLPTGTVQVRYLRSVQMENAPPTVSSWTATLRWIAVSQVRPEARLANPMGYIVTDYHTDQDSAPPAPEVK